MENILILGAGLSASSMIQYILDQSELNKWNVVVGDMDVEMAKHESPSTDRFYTLSNLKNKKSPEYIDFFDRVVSLTGITVKGRKRKA